MPLKKLGELTIPSRQDQLAKVDQYIEKLVGRLSLPAGDVDDIAIAVSEAVNNAIVHGNRLDPRRSVRIIFYVCSTYLRIIVQDEGKGFLLTNVPDPRQEENLLKVSGRGILIMRHLMDRIAFKLGKRGMQVIMDKRCPEGC